MKTNRRIRPQVELMEGRTLLSAGALDTSFGGTGMVTTMVGSYATKSFAVAVQSDLKVVVAGYSANTNSPTHFALARYNPDGTLDTGFGTGGVVVFPVTTNLNGDGTFAVAIQPDGKIVAAGFAYVSGSKKGTSADDWAVVRLNANGTTDTTFGGGTGKVITAFYPASSSPTPVEVQAIVIQPDGKIVVAGQAATSQGSQALGVVRYNSNGSLDAGFRAGGLAINTNIAWSGPGSMVAVDTSGRIDVVGIVDATPQKMGVTRYLPNGILDSTFGTGGLVTLLPAGSSSAQAHAIGLQSTGKIVVYGPSSFPNHPLEATLVRLNTDGSLDTTFGSGGLYTDGRLFVPYGMVVQPVDDKIVAVARPFPYSPANSQFAVTRVLADGSSADDAFGSSGIALTAFPVTGTVPRPDSVSLAPDGKVVVTGEYATNTSFVFAVARFLGDSSNTPATLATTTTSPGATVANNLDLLIAPLIWGDHSFVDSLARGNMRHRVA